MFSREGPATICRQVEFPQCIINTFLCANYFEFDVISVVVF